MDTQQGLVTPTHREREEAFFRLFDDGPSHDTDMQDQTPSQQHFTVAIDFGTTFSSVAYVVLDDAETKNSIDPLGIQCVDQFPYAPGGSFELRTDVPTESWYQNGMSQRFNTTNLGRMSGEARPTIAGASNDDEEIIASTRAVRADADLDGVDGGIYDQTSERYHWGYGVQNQLKKSDSNYDETLRISRSKLMLDASQHTAEIRTELDKKTKKLMELGLITEPTDIITDYLVSLLRQTKEHLEQPYDFSKTSLVEFVLCVPVIWTSKACRAMQAMMATAVERSGFTNLQNGCIENLFIVSEAEAAAAWVLAGSNEINPGDTFVLLDAGGGTVDAIMYTMRKSTPLRLKEEVVKPTGALCGSSYLNENFRRIIWNRLKDELYLERNGKTIQKIVEAKVVEFENETKRMIDVSISSRTWWSIPIDGLQRNKEKRFEKGKLLLSVEEIDNIFDPCLQGVADVLMNQLSAAKTKGVLVKRILLIGGFAASKSLRGYLEKFVAKINQSQVRPIKLVSRGAPLTAVARGAVLRALRKDDGPARILQSSYGFLRHEPYNPALEAHKGESTWYDSIDGVTYITNTIDWLIKKDDEVPSLHEYRMIARHTWDLTERDFICSEDLYVSDERCESHYKNTHPMNKGAERIGSISADMKFLKSQGLLQPVKREGGKPGQKYYRVDIELVMIVDGLNLRYEARHPVGDGGKVQGKGQTCIAAAFVPGTK